MYYARLFASMLIIMAVCGQPAETIAKEVPRTGQIGCYDTKGKPVEFEGSGQDGEQQRGAVWPIPRFMVNDDGTVLDKLTGLVWLADGKCFDAINWIGAKKKIAELNTVASTCKGYSGNYNDWLLPSVGQMASLLDADVLPADYLRTQGFKGVQAGSYWTSTVYQNLLTAWTVDFADGSVIFQEKLEKLFLLPVRQADGRDAKADNDNLANEPARDGALTLARFIDNNDGTVTDKQSGLMWLRGCLSNLDWHGAILAGRSLNTARKSNKCNYDGTYSDWVLPNRLELMSLVDYSRDYPALYPGVFDMGMSVGEYWSSTSVASAPENAYTANFGSGRQSFADKTKKGNVLLVRRIDSSPLPPRLESAKAAGNLNINSDYLLALAPELHSDIAWPPPPRFLDNGDGTSMDRLTGITWLSDGNCFGRKSWQDAREVMKKFNSDPRKFDCKGYEVTFGDWEIPAIDEMKNMLNPAVNDSAAWLNSQGITNLQSGGDYWSKSETLINLYYAKVLRFKGDGKVMPYPKSLKFFLWPHRVLPTNENKTPFLTMTVNAISDAIELAPTYPISLVVFTHTFGQTFPADFWLWYDTPDGKQLWLSGIRSWNDQMKPVYQGPLFNMRNYEIFRSPANGLAPGLYTFHFAVDSTPDGVLDKIRYEAKVPVTITAQKD